MPCGYEKDKNEHLKRKKSHREGKYSSKEARAGHKYNMSHKHRESESRGMKRTMRGR